MILIAVLCEHNKVIGVDLMEFGASSKDEQHFEMSTLVINIILEVLNNIKTIR